VALNLGNHLLQSPDGLVTTLLGDLVVEVVVATIAVLPHTVLVLVGHVLLGGVLEVGEAGGGTLTGVDIVTTALVLGGVASLVSSSAGVVAAEGLPGVDLAFDVVSRHVGNIVPGVVIRGVVDLVQLVLAWVDLVGSLGGGVTSNVAGKDGGIRNWA